MKKLNYIELLNSSIILFILLIILSVPNYLPKFVFQTIYFLVLIRFIFPPLFILPRFISVDFSKILNSIIWTLIILLICFIDYHDNHNSIIEKGTMGLFLLYCYFQLMRGSHFLWNNEEPIFVPKYKFVGDFIKIKNRAINKRDSDFTVIYIVFYLIVLVILVNI